MKEKLPAAPAPAPEKLSHKMELMRESHKQALAAYNLEKLIVDRPDIDYADIKNDPEIDAILDTVDRPRALADFLCALEKYIDRRGQSKRQMRKLRKMYRGGGAEKPEGFGRFVFEQVAKRKPKGKVIFKQEEAYFIMVCENSEDYAYAYGSAAARAGEVGPPDFSKADLSGGNYHRRIYLDLGKGSENLPIMLVRREEEKYIVIHERQHFINDKLFDLFRATETASLDKAKNEAARPIKDEMLAFIRDGRSGDDMERILSGKLYEDLFKDFTPEEESRYGDIITKTGDFLDLNGAMLADPDARAILTYQLAGIPLDRFPAWLKEFENYYSARLKFVRSFDKIADHRVARELSSLPGETFPEKVVKEGDVGALNESLDKMGKIFCQASDLIYGMDMDIKELEKKIKELLSKYAAEFKKIQRAIKRLDQDGVFPPHASPTETVHHGQLTKESVVEETPYTERIKKAVVEAVADFPQDEIEKIEAYLSGKKKDKPRAMMDLAIVIETVVFRENNGRKCEVYFNQSTDYDGAFITSVEYGVSFEEESKNKIKEASFVVHFHGAKGGLLPKR